MYTKRHDVKFCLQVLIFICVPILLGFLKTGYNKATEEDELILISSEKEKRIGASLAKKVEEKFGETDDPLIQVRIEKIGKRITEVCERKDLVYHFKVLKAEEEDNYNAFALPGGYVYIFDVFVLRLKDDDKIAAILAHEVGHIAAKHSVKRLQSAMGMNALMLLGIGVSADRRNLADAMYAINHLMGAYSREAELQADKLSIRYMKRAGFDPEGIIHSLELMKYVRKKGPIRRYIENRSHPYLSERISKAQVEIKGKTDFESFINLPKHIEEF